MVYDVMAERALELLVYSKYVVLDATFYLKEFRNQMREVAGKAGVDFFVIECVLDEDIVRERLKGRKKGEAGNDSEADFAVYGIVKKVFEPIEGEHIRIDTSLPVENNVQKAIWFLSKNGSCGSGC